MNANNCPRRELLQAYHTGDLPEESAEEVIAHLSQCSTCQAALATLEAAPDSLVARLRRPEVEAYAAEPQCREMRARVMAGHGEKQPRLDEKPDDGPSLDVFCQRLVDSGLMTAEDVEQFIAGLPAENRPTTARQLAREMHRHGLITRFQAQAVYEGKTRGLVLGNYAVLAKLGQGGMGQVYTAQHRKMKRVVAIKMLPSSSTRSPEAVKRFQREVQAAAKLSHSNIVTAFDADEANGVHFLVMEFVDGQDLTALVKRHGPLSPAQAVDCVVQAARGLEYAHHQGVIHRDIKPSNLLLDKNGVVKILDMGLARLENAVGGSDNGLTQTGNVMGTLDYMAPEQAFDTHHADARSDVYSLGCTLYYLLAGRSPFHGDSVTQKILAHREAPVPSLRASRKDVPEWLDGVFQQMLAKNPADRPQTMTAVMTLLQQNSLPQTGPLTPIPAPSVRPGNTDETLSFHKPEVETSSEKLDAEMPLGEFVRPQSIVRRRRKSWVGNLLAARVGGPLARLSRRQRIAVVVAAGMMFAFVMFSAILSLRTKNGTLVVEIDDPNVTLQVLSEQGKVQIERKGERGTIEIGVDPGKHRLRLQKNGVEVFAQDFTLSSGGKEIIRARLERSAPTPNAQSPAPPLAIAPFDEKKAKEHQAAWAKHLGVPVETTNSIGMKTVLIPPGEFMMGAPEDETGRTACEGPQHRARITKPFYMGAYAVTQEEYERVMGDNPSWFQHSAGGKDSVAEQDTRRLPVEMVSWDSAMEFCRRLSALPEEKAAGHVYRLPTEAQWEYACRAGTTTPFSFGRFCSGHEANCIGYGLCGTAERGPNLRRTTAVGSYPPNTFGLYDMHGNVWQWCADWHDSEYAEAYPVDDLGWPRSGAVRMLRGGAWNLVPHYARSASRVGRAPGEYADGFGFRVSWTPWDGQESDAAAIGGSAEPKQDTTQSGTKEPTASANQVALPVWKQLDISAVCHADVISTDSHQAADTFTFNGGTLASASWLRKYGYSEPGLPDDGRVPIPDSEPSGFFQVRVPPAKNAILLTGPDGPQPLQVVAELAAEQHHHCSKVAILHATCWGNGTMNVALRYENGPEATATVPVFDWGNKTSDVQMPDNLRHAVTARDTHPQYGYPASMYAAEVPADPQRELRAITFSVASRAPQTGYSEEDTKKRFTIGVFAISVLSAPRPSPPEAKMAPGTVEPSKESDGKRSTGDRDVRKRWLGYTVQRNPAKAVEEIAPYTNVVIDHGWSDYGDALIQAARRQHKKVVLAFFGKWERGEFEQRGLEMARKNRDVVFAVSRFDSDLGCQPADLSRFGEMLHKESPALEFWCLFSPEQDEPWRSYDIPKEVDKILVNCHGVNSPGTAETLSDRILPRWRARAAGRPVLFYWTCFQDNAPGLIPKCEIGTFARCAQLVKTYNIAGLLVDNYGSEPGRELHAQPYEVGSNPERIHEALEGLVGLQTRPELVKEVQEIGRSWGISKSDAAAEATSSAKDSIPVNPTLSVKPPKEAIVLFDGKAEQMRDNWYARHSTDPADWTVDDKGVATPNEGDIVSKKEFGDCYLHVEFCEPLEGDGNSGVGMQGRYEIQILNSYGKKPETHECGAFYDQTPPKVIASKPAGEWQTFDIFFRAPRFDTNGEVVEKARATMYQNGILIHENAEFKGPTGIEYQQYKGEVSKGPIILQGDQDAVQFRNVWIVPAKY